MIRKMMFPFGLSQLVWFLCWLAGVAGLAAQQVRFDHLTLDHGLSHSTVNDILQDQRGFIWIATQDGLNRFDGYDVVIFEPDPENLETLSHNWISAIHQDRQGQFWIFPHAHGAIDHLDPDTGRTRRFAHDPSDSNSLSADTYWPGVFYEDVEGTIWLATQNGQGLDKLAPDTGFVTHLVHDPTDPESLPSQQVTAILEDSTGTVWVATEGGLARRITEVDDAQERFSTYRHDPEKPDSLGSDRLTALYEDRDGVLWIGTDGAGLYRYDRERDAFDRPPQPAAADEAVPSNTIPRFEPTLQMDIAPMLEDRAGRLWVSTGAGLVMLERDRQTFTYHRHRATDRSSLSHDSVTALLEDSEGQLWVGTADGLNRYQADSAGFDRYVHDPGDADSLGASFVYRLFEDRTGVLWIGTSAAGADRLSPHKHVFKTYRPSTNRSSEIGDDVVFVIHEDPAGQLWIGTHQSGLYRLDADRREVVEHFSAKPGRPNDLKSDWVLALHEDSFGRFWVATGGAGLALIDPVKGEVVRHFRHDPQDAASLTDDFIWMLEGDSDGSLWLATPSGLNHFDPESGRAKAYVHNSEDPSSIHNDVIYVVHIDRGGTLWAGGVGLNRFDRDSQTFTRFVHDSQTPDSLGNDIVLALHSDDHGHLWVGTTGGLDRMETSTGRFTHFREGQGLASDMVLGILPDDAGHLWFSTTRGLSRFDEATETFTNYDSGEGLPSNDFNIGARLKSRSGELFFGSVNGLVAFDPEAVQPSTVVPPVVLTAFRKFDRIETFDVAIEDLEDIQLNYQENFFAFEFAALDYHHPSQHLYAYKLEGFDTDWIESGKRRYASYTNLDGGSYTFRVKASNGDGLWNEEGAAVTVVVESPPWKTWWAYSLYVLGLLAVLGAFVVGQSRRVARERAVNARLREIDRLKDEFLANTSHELRTPLHGITGLADSLIDGAAGEVSEPIRANLEMIAGSGRRLSHLVNDILDFSKLRHRNLELDLRAVELHSLVDVVLTLSATLVDTKDLRLVNRVSKELPAVAADEDRLQQILYNLIGNAIKFTDDGVVKVSAEAQDERLTVQVTDTGIGIPLEQQERIFGAFEQADGSIEREYGGTGLGLAVTRQLVELHGGELRVTSSPGAGSTFTFDLPIASEGLSESSRLTEVATISPGTLSPSVNGESAADLSAASNAADSAEILVVDDDRINRQVLINHLEGEGYKMIQAASGREALELLEKRRPDLILLDVMMPRMSGYEVCKTLRQRFPLDELPVLFLTAKTQTSDLIVGLAAGANDYLTKPVSKSELLARVQTHLALLLIHRELSKLVAERTAQVQEREGLLSERERLINVLEAKNAELARFSYTVAHDLRNPLVTIKNFLDLARRDAKEGETVRLEHDLERLHLAADKMHLLLDELHELSKVELQPNPLVQVAFDDLLQAALSKLKDVIEERGAAIEIALTLPDVRGDRSRLEEMLRHLVQNALQHGEPNRAPKIQIGVRSGDRALEEPFRVFFVRDNGPGIEPQYHEKIFDLFERLNPETSTGTGVGLALAKRIVQAHGGQLWVESEGVGQGSTFYFSLPVTADSRLETGAIGVPGRSEASTAVAKSASP